MLRRLLLLGALALPLAYTAPVQAQAVPISGHWTAVYYWWSFGHLFTGSPRTFCLQTDPGYTDRGRWTATNFPNWRGRWRANRDVLTLVGKAVTYTTVAQFELQTPNAWFGHYSHFFADDTTDSLDSNGGVTLTRTATYCYAAFTGTQKTAGDPAK